MAGDHPHVLGGHSLHQSGSFRIFTLEHLRAAPQDGDLAAHGREEMAEFAAYVACPNDDQALGQTLQPQQRDIVQKARLLQAGDGRHKRPGARGDHYFGSGNGLVAYCQNIIVDKLRSILKIG